MRRPVPSSGSRSSPTATSTRDPPRSLLLKQTRGLLLRLPTLPRFNLAICALSKNPPLRLHALLLYARMTRLGLSPDNFTYPFLLNSCAALPCPLLAGELHSRVLRSGHFAVLQVGNALLDLYAKLRDLTSACRLFDEMPLRDLVTCNSLLGAYARTGARMDLARDVFDGMPQRNVITWNAILAGYSNSGNVALARHMFNQMHVRNIISWNTMIVAHVRCGDVGSARELFDRMPERNLVSWAALISGYVQAGRPREALTLFENMTTIGLVPDAATMVGVISSSSQLGSTHLANWVGSYVDHIGIDRNTRILTALVDMHAKCGNTEEACRLFEEIPCKDAFSYTALITGLASHGRRALEFFNRMLRECVEPDGVTYVGVLNACSHAGLVDEGVRYWDMMVSCHGIEPCSDHYACMVDMLGRVGRLREACELVASMPGGPHTGALGALLAACRSHGEVAIAEVVAEKLFELEPANTGNYMLLWGIYAASGEWDKASRLRERMKEKGMKKLPGSSWT